MPLTTSQHSAPARFRLLVALLLALAGTTSQAASAHAGNSAAPRPNVLLILADDMGVNDLGHINHDQTHTPNLDRLAAQGISFSRHYTDSSCSPSRVALLTGMNPARTGFHPTGLALPDDIVTLPELLRRNGYHTAMFGKWHAGDLVAGDGPDKHGFDQWFGMLAHFYLSGAMLNGHLVGRTPVYMNPWLQLDGGAPKQYEGHIDDLLTAHAIEAIGKKSKQPWFIYVPFLSPHTPTVPNAAFAAKYPDTPEGRYRAVIEQLDSNIGALLQQVKEAGAADNTIVVFVSDNGGTGSAFPSNAPFDGSKATYAEGGIRTPLIVYWPRHWTGGKRIDDVKYIADIYPTLAKALRLKTDGGLDGVDLFKRRTQPLFWYSQNLLVESYSALSADGKWRMHGANGTFGLVRYAADLQSPESTDNEAMREKLKQEYLQWRDTTTRLPGFGAPAADSRSLAVANLFRPTASVGFSFSLPAMQGGESVPLVSNKQFDLSYAAGEFVLKMDAATLRFPYRPTRACNALYMNLVINQDDSIFYHEGISWVDLYVNDDQPINGKFKIDRIDSRNFSLLSPTDFHTQPGGPIAARSVAVATRLLTKPEIAPALDALNRSYCAPSGR